MDIQKRIIKNFDDQKLLFEQYEKLIDEFSRSDLQKENESLKKRLEDIKTEFEKVKNEHQKLTEENIDLKLTLKEQVFDEKANILKVSKSKLDTYFKNNSETKNRLHSLEISLKYKIRELKLFVENKFIKNKEEALSSIDQLTVKLKKQLEDQRSELEREELSLKDKISSSYKKLHNEEIDEEVLEKRKKQNKLELKIGLNVFNKLGIFLILIAIGVAAKYSYSTWFNDYAKGILFFTIGIIMLSLGEVFFRKNNDVFSKGMIGGGIAVLYSATFFSYFSLKIIDMNMGLVISLLITVIAIVLSIRYNSKIIASFALTGGYIPFITYIFAFSLEGSQVYAGMVYLFILNLSLLLISFYKNWKVTNYLSFFLNLPSYIYLVFIADNSVAAILYSILIFIMYLGITLLYPMKYKIKLKVPDIVLLALNTVTSCAVVYTLFDTLNIESYRGVLALVFALVYIGLGIIVKRKMEMESETIALFFGTALTFVVLMIPFQFGVDWLSMGWLVEGLILSIVGYRFRIKPMEYAGLGIFGISAGSFLIFDLLEVSGFTPFMEFKFSMVILAMISLLVNYMLDVKKGEITPYSTRGRRVQVYKIVTVVCFYFYCIYMGNYIYYKFYNLKTIKPLLSGYLFSFYNSVIIAFINIALAIVLPKIKLIADRSIRLISTILNVISILICLVLTVQEPVLADHIAANGALKIFSIILLVLFNFYSLIRVREITIKVIDRNGISLEMYPVILSTYLLGVLTSIIIFQFDLGQTNLIISFLFLIFAIGNIIFGFLKKYTYIRLFGLGLSLFSTGKLFLWDLRHLTMGSKIIAYFGFGIVLILISFIYQKINKEINQNNVK